MLSNELSFSTVRSVDSAVLDALIDDWENIFDSKIMTIYVYDVRVICAWRTCKTLIGNMVGGRHPNPN